LEPYAAVYALTAYESRAVGSIVKTVPQRADAEFPPGCWKLTLTGKIIAPEVSFLASPPTHSGGQFAAIHGRLLYRVSPGIADAARPTASSGRSARCRDA